MRFPRAHPAGESQSNGVVENGVKLLKGLVRVHVLALERKLGVRFPADHPALAWVVEAVGDLATKHLRGSDGRTGYERLFGKSPREEGLELGEMVLWRRPNQGGQRPPGGQVGARSLAREDVGRRHPPYRGRP